MMRVPWRLFTTARSEAPISRGNKTSPCLSQLRPPWPGPPLGSPRVLGLGRGTGGGRTHSRPHQQHGSSHLEQRQCSAPRAGGVLPAGIPVLTHGLLGSRNHREQRGAEDQSYSLHMPFTCRLMFLFFLSYTDLNAGTALIN